MVSEFMKMSRFDSLPAHHARIAGVRKENPPALPKSLLGKACEGFAKPPGVSIKRGLCVAKLQEPLVSPAQIQPIAEDICPTTVTYTEGGMLMRVSVSIARMHQTAMPLLYSIIDHVSHACAHDGNRAQ